MWGWMRGEGEGGTPVIPACRMENEFLGSKVSLSVGRVGAARLTKDLMGKTGKPSSPGLLVTKLSICPTPTPDELALLENRVSCKLTRKSKTTVL